MCESTSGAHGSHVKEIKQDQLELKERHDAPVSPARGAADASSDGIACESKAFRTTSKQVAVDETSKRGKDCNTDVAEAEWQRRLDHLRQTVEEELSGIAGVVATSLRDAANVRPLHPPPPLQGLPSGGAEMAGTFAVIDETAPMSSSRIGLQESARRQSLELIAGQVQKDILKFQDCINGMSSLAADKLGNRYPDDPVARDYQVALVQLQLRLNEGLASTLNDVMARIHPAAQVPEITPMSGDLLTLPESIRQRHGLGAGCGKEASRRSGPCCGGQHLVLANARTPRLCEQP